MSQKLESPKRKKKKKLESDYHRFWCHKSDDITMLRPCALEAFGTGCGNSLEGLETRAEKAALKCYKPNLM